MSVLPIPDPLGFGDGVEEDQLVQHAEQLLRQANALVQLKKKVASLQENQNLLSSQQQQLSQKIEQVEEAIDRRDKFLPIIPEIEKLGVSIPESMKAQIGKECKLIAKTLGDDPKSRLKEGIGRFDVITYPRELVGPIARAWFAIHRSNAQRANWFKKLWKINAPFSVKEEITSTQIQDAKDLILEALAKGPQESNKILDQMDKKGIPNQVWIEAKSQLGVVVKQASNGRLIWSLPKK